MCLVTYQQFWWVSLLHQSESWLHSPVCHPECIICHHTYHVWLLCFPYCVVIQTPAVLQAALRPILAWPICHWYPHSCWVQVIELPPGLYSLASVPLLPHYLHHSSLFHHFRHTPHYLFLLRDCTCQDVSLDCG